MLNQEQTNFLMTKAYNAAVRSGALILDIFNGQKSRAGTRPLTVADSVSHEQIKSYLGQTRIPMLSAEGRDLLYQERCNWDLFWMVDPLDGTHEFIRGNGEFTVNIALMCDNRPQFGLIYVPYIHKLYFAIKGQGAYLKTGLLPTAEFESTLDGIWEGARRLPLSTEANAPVRIAISRSHNTPETHQHVDRLKMQYPGAEVVEQGSSYKFCMLAEGMVDAYVRTSDTFEWDTAAGELILREAGGTIASLAGEPLGYNKQSLLNPHFHCCNKHLAEMWEPAAAVI